MQLTSDWRQYGRERCYSGGCPDQLYAGGVEWTEVRQLRTMRRGVLHISRVQIRTCWATAGRTMAGPARDATPEEAAEIG